MARILVTGSEGFIGRNLVPKLIELGHDVVGFSRKGIGIGTQHSHFQCDITNESHVAYVMEFIEPTIVCHLAANPIVRYNEGNPTQISKDNILGTHNLLAYAPTGCKFIYASSATVYGNNVDEDEEAKCEPTSVYGATKIASEALVDAYTSLGRVNGTNLRLVANVGLHSTHGLLHDIIRKLKSDSKELELLGKGPGSWKPYTHISDTVSAFVMAQRWPNGTYNISNGLGTLSSVLDVAEQVMKETGIKKNIKWLGEAANWKGDNRVVNVNSNKARKAGWQPQYDCSQAISLAVQEIMKEEKCSQS